MKRNEIKIGQEYRSTKRSMPITVKVLTVSEPNSDFGHVGLSKDGEWWDEIIIAAFTQNFKPVECDMCSPYGTPGFIINA